MPPLSSSNLASADYDAQSKALTIIFASGAVYQYAGVDQVVYDDLMGASSAGEYFYRNIKNRYPTTRIG